MVAVQGLVLSAISARYAIFFFSSRRRHTRLVSDWSSDVCSSDLPWSRSRITQRRRWAEQTPDSIHNAGSPPRVNLDVTFFFKPFRTAPGVAQIFAGIAARLHFQANGPALKRSANFHDALAVRVIETLGNPQNRGQPSQDGLIGVIQGGIRGVVSSRFRLAVVIAHQTGDDGAFAAPQRGNIAVQNQVFSVFVMSTVADHVSGIMQQRSRFEKHARLRR